LNRLFGLLLGAGLLFAPLSGANGQIPGQGEPQARPLPRLPASVLDVTPPSEWVRGTPSQMTLRPGACRNNPTAGIRRRIVDVAVQEWGFFAFSIDDQTDEEDENDDPRRDAANGADNNDGFNEGRRRRLPPEEAVRVAPSVGGYWAVTPNAAGMIANQNEEWSGPRGIGRWADPWSAAFISWVMCEAGLGEMARFQRAIAHWTYIDQAIRARDGKAPQAAYVAYELGESVVAPGDLLCSSRRPEYHSVDQRRRQMGVGARSHCDIVVKIDEANMRILTIGGNVRRAVSMKFIPAVRASAGGLRPSRGAVGDAEREIFAHLKLRADPIEMSALDSSPTMKALGCALTLVELHPARTLVPARQTEDAC
jgi:hypothetical protein